MKGLPEDILAGLGRLGPLLGAGASLNPIRSCVPPPVELVGQVMEGGEDVERVRAFAWGLGELVCALAEDFPDNIFWDLEHLACCMWKAGGPRQIEDFARRVVRLCRGFGNKSELRFRYAHDFLYGYDWARWVARAPGERADIGPFDPVFLDYLEDRCQKLLELISRDDSKYGRLQGPGFRNPFAFCREPREEAHLHHVLAQADLIPVKAWRLDGERRWDLPFTDLRTEAARRLGLSQGATT